MFYSCVLSPVTIRWRPSAPSRSDCSNTRRNPQKSTSVCVRLSVAAFTRKRRGQGSTCDRQGHPCISLVVPVRYQMSTVSLDTRIGFD